MFLLQSRNRTRNDNNFKYIRQSQPSKPQELNESVKEVVAQTISNKDGLGTL